MAIGHGGSRGTMEIHKKVWEKKWTLQMGYITPINCLIYGLMTWNLNKYFEAKVIEVDGSNDFPVQLGVFWFQHVDFPGCNKTGMGSSLTSLLWRIAGTNHS